MRHPPSSISPLCLLQQYEAISYDRPLVAPSVLTTLAFVDARVVNATTVQYCTRYVDNLPKHLFLW